MPKTKTPAQIIDHALAEIDRLDAERKAIAEEKSGEIERLCHQLSISKKALNVFLARRKLDEDDRLDFDASLQRLADASGAPFQADLFAQPPAMEDPEASGARLQ